MEGDIPLTLFIAVFMMALILVLVLYGVSFISIMDLQDYESWTDAFGWAIFITFSLLFVSFFQFEIVPGPARVTINLTGVVVPVAVSLYVLLRKRIRVLPFLGLTALVALVTFPLVQYREGFLVLDFPLWLLPALVGAAMIYFFVRGSWESKLALAYASGSMGVFIGGDLIKLWSLPSSGGSSIFLGYNGLLDFVFLMGVFAAALMGVFWFLGHRFERVQSARA
ncbi:MAG TPA: DUF1614 domain-containing protein [Methanomassiliicoccales archaeon]|nr:DUF1614 domain-containing protein [Methanomassiliicoccales archaeon]